jgi:hypothetical protein
VIDDDARRVVEQLWSEREIRRAVIAYCRALDEGRETFPGTEGFAIALGSHQVTNCRIDFGCGSDSAEVVSDLLLTLRIRAGDGSDVVILTGRLIDSFERREDEWTLAERTTRVDVDSVNQHRPLYPPDVHRHRFARAGGPTP